MASGLYHHQSQLPTVPQEPRLSEQHWGSEQNPALKDCILSWRGAELRLRGDKGRRAGEATAALCISAIAASPTRLHGPRPE